LTPLRESGCVPLCRVYRLYQIVLALEVPDQPRHAMRFHGGERAVQPAVGQRANLLEGAGGQHRVEPAIDPVVELRSIEIEKGLDRELRIEGGLRALRVPLRERTAGRQN